MNVQFDFSGRHAVVFGGTTGINLGIAQAFARAGARVTVASRKQANVDAAVATLGDGALGLRERDGSADPLRGPPCGAGAHAAPPAFAGDVAHAAVA